MSDTLNVWNLPIFAWAADFEAETAAQRPRQEAPKAYGDAAWDRYYDAVESNQRCQDCGSESCLCLPDWETK